MYIPFSSLRSCFLFSMFAIIFFVFNAVIEYDSKFFHLSYAQTIPDFNFGVTAGDWGCTADTQQTVNNIVNKNPAIVLWIGRLFL